MEDLQQLAVYGTLAPGKPNHHHLADLPGRWFAGQVSGRLVEAGWGAGMGYPALVLDPDGASVEVQVFESAELTEHWARLDDFEGAEYERVVATVSTAEGEVSAYIYTLRGE